jgi:hypothetical protein
MLNGTLCATERALCCLIETHQTPDGINIPEVRLGLTVVFRDHRVGHSVLAGSAAFASLLIMCVCERKKTETQCRAGTVTCADAQVLQPYMLGKKFIPFKRELPVVKKQGAEKKK